MEKITATNVSSNSSTTPMPSYDPEEVHSIDNNYQNIEDLFTQPTNFPRMQNVSTNTTTCTSKGTDSYFELIVEALRQLVGFRFGNKEILKIVKSLVTNLLIMEIFT